jgi:hypothetical protein
MKTKRVKAPKPRTPAKAKEAKGIDVIEQEHWPVIKAKIDAARASVAKGKGRKWDLDRFLSEAERRRKSKLAAE